MLKKIRIFLLIVDWLSLLIVPWCGLAWACYAGLCPGAPSEIRERFNEFYGQFMWIYFVVVVGSLLLSRYFKKREKLRAAILALIIPIICLLPLVYVEIQVAGINARYFHS